MYTAAGTADVGEEDEGDTEVDMQQQQQLCDGHEPAVELSTGRMYDCDACPSSTYCHRLSTTSACCWISPYNHLSPLPSPTHHCHPRVYLAISYDGELPLPRKKVTALAKHRLLPRGCVPINIQALDCCFSWQYVHGPINITASNMMTSQFISYIATYLQLTT